MLGNVGLEGSISHIQVCCTKLKHVKGFCFILEHSPTLGGFLHKCLFTDVCLHGSWPVLPVLSLAPILSLACALSLPAPPTHTNTIEEVELSRILENFE